MSDDLIARVAGAIREEADKHDGPTTFDLLAESAIRETLAALREPSAPMLACGTLAAATTGDIAPEHAEQVEMQRRTIEQASRGAFRSAFCQAVRVFARENGIQMPRAAPPGAGEGTSGHRRDARPSPVAPPTESPGNPASVDFPPTHRTHGGHATCSPPKGPR